MMCLLVVRTSAMSRTAIWMNGCAAEFYFSCSVFRNNSTAARRSPMVTRNKLRRMWRQPPPPPTTTAARLVPFQRVVFCSTIVWACECQHILPQTSIRNTSISFFFQFIQFLCGMWLPASRYVEGVLYNEAGPHNVHIWNFRCNENTFYKI